MRLRSILQITATLLATASVAKACLWLHGTTIDGHLQKGMPFSADSLRAAIGMIPRDQPALFKAHEYKPDDPIAKANDSAVTQLLRGDARLAVEMLEQVETKYPGAYFTAANLGTAYELSANDEKALKWILEGIKRNPDSHMRTEWLHARILQAKIKLKADPTWLAKNSISGVDLTRLREKGYHLDTVQRQVAAEDIVESLQRQLSVRILFVKPKDPIVAHLLKELALCEAQIGLLENANAYAELAVRYGLPAQELKAEVSKWREIIQRAGTVRKR